MAQQVAFPRAETDQRRRYPSRHGVLRTMLVAAGLGFSGPVLADSIDGNWCNSAGNKQMSIAGSHLVTSSGKTIEGRYSRHSFAYTVPDSEPGAGAPVSLLLMNENTIRATTGQEPTPEVWHRCEQTS